MYMHKVSMSIICINIKVLSRFILCTYFMTTAFNIQFSVNGRSARLTRLQVLALQNVIFQLSLK